MAKKIVSGGGGGSHGAPVTFMDALVAEAKRSEPPAGSFSVADFARKTGWGVKKAHAFLMERKAAGELEGAKLTDSHGPAWYFWPARLG